MSHIDRLLSVVDARPISRGSLSTGRVAAVRGSSSGSGCTFSARLKLYDSSAHVVGTPIAILQKEWSESGRLTVGVGRGREGLAGASSSVRFQTQTLLSRPCLREDKRASWRHKCIRLESLVYTELAGAYVYNQPVS